ncbi:MAG: TonB-dependent receptor plug domain-containing protein [Kofleriaceae bacterium]
MRQLKRTLFVVVLGAHVAHAQGPAPEEPPAPPANTPAPESPPTPTPEAPPSETPAGEEIVIVGRVIDVLGKPVRGARITLEGGTEPIGKTDRLGRFTVRAPMGATLVVESKAFGVGIATVTGRALDDIVLLTEKQLGETIRVESDAPTAAPGAAQLDRRELQRVPGTGGDVVRALTVMPGVVNLQVPLGYSGVVVRGSSPQDSKVFVDDFDVPVLYHNLGFRAIVPAETIESLDFVPGGFDVAYGRASSGIVLLKTRAGSEKRSTQAELSVIDGGLLAQGPIDSKSRYMFALRRSTIDFVLPSVIPDSVNLSLTTVPRYWDGQLRLDRELSEKWRGTLSLVGTDDTFELIASKNEDADTKRFFNRTRFLRTTAALRFKDGPWTANIALSTLLPQFIFELGAYQYIRSSQPTVTPRFEVTRNEPEAIGLKNVEWRVGAEAPIAKSNVKIALPIEPREGEGNPEMFDPRDTSTNINTSVWLPDIAAWTAVAADLHPRVRVTAGVRAEAFVRQDEFSVSPRGEVSVKLTADGDWKLRANAGAFRRPAEFQSELLSDTAKSERSKQTILGLQWEPEEGIRVQASTYYNDRTALLRADEMGKLTNTGRGKTYGGEFLGTYRKGPWFTWLSYSYSKSTRVDAPGANERLFDFDQPHSMNAAASYKIGNWILGARWQLYSGLPFTPVEGGIFDSDRNIYIPINGDINSGRAPIHHQLDIRVDYNWRWGPIDLTAFLDIQNLYMNESVVTYFYSYDFSERVAFTSIPIIPAIGLRGVF